MMTHRVFITGTDTGVGKTHFTVWLARELQDAGLSVGAYKPACSGAEFPLSTLPASTADAGSVGNEPTWEDAQRLAGDLNHPWPIDRIAPQRFVAPLAPPVAAALESRDVDENLLISAADWWNDRVDVLLIEGAGGWLSPISTNWTNADLAARLQSPVLLVAAQRLGVINHTLLTIDAIRRNGAALVGVVMNEVWPSAVSGQALVAGLDQSNIEEIERRSGVRILGTLTHGKSPSFQARDPVNPPDWRSLLIRDR